MIELALQITLALVKRFEGCVLTPYLCPAGVPSIGFGATRYEDGTAVQLTDPAITPERAEKLLLHQVLTIYLPAVIRLCPNAATPQRIGLLGDFCYNLGVGALAASRLRRRVNEDRWVLVPTELRRWTHGGGRVLPGLVLRREAEISLI